MGRRTLLWGFGVGVAAVGLSWSGVASAQFFAASDAAVLDAGGVKGETSAAARGVGVDEGAPLALSLGLSSEMQLAVAGQSTSAGELGLAGRFAGESITLKRLLVPGSLQASDGVSVAMEIGWAVPRADEVRGVLALSQAWPAATLHLNAGLTRHAEGSVAPEMLTFVEGPPTWQLRPALELYAVRDAALVTGSRWGVIWDLSERLALSAGAGREHRSDATTEFGVGLEWSALD